MPALAVQMLWGGSLGVSPGLPLRTLTAGHPPRKRDGSTGAEGTSATPRPLRGPRTRPVF